MSNITPTETVEKKSLRQKILAPIKNHPKLAIAVAAGVALVAGAAILGKDDFPTDELRDAEVVDDSVPTEN